MLVHDRPDAGQPASNRQHIKTSVHSRVWSVRWIFVPQRAPTPFPAKGSDPFSDPAVPAEVREVLGEVLEYWFFERFRGLTAKEIWAMLNLVTPIQETRAYQSIFAEGEVKGEAKGKVEGTVPAWAERRIDAAEIAQLDVWLDGIFDAANVEDLIGSESG
ncbi:hypothetical protein [Thiocapsa sp. UBA6158]|jgi:hypothetical protein|uniref:hypothetical protein n=1 Tax=Thiocapsa sp. UBA6158 TaxID=1947692 RepID=UPI0025DB6122|nr:hypothetical protein [Thiocapsa sp. UBA6158]